MLAAVAGGCLLLGLAVGWAIGRFASPQMLYLIWGLLLLAFGWGFWPAIQVRLGQPQDAWDGAARIALAVVVIGPTFLASLLGGWLGLRQKARKDAE